MFGDAEVEADWLPLLLLDGPDLLRAELSVVTGLLLVVLVLLLLLLLVVATFFGWWL